MKPSNLVTVRVGNRAELHSACAYLGTTLSDVLRVSMSNLIGRAQKKGWKPLVERRSHHKKAGE